jgi:hypothetical protein
MKRFMIAVMLVFAATLTGFGLAMADTDEGSGIVGVQAP